MRFIFQSTLKTLATLVVTTAILSVASISNAGIVAYWGIEETGGTTTKELIGNGDDLVDGATFTAPGAGGFLGSTSSLDFSTATTASNADHAFGGIAGAGARTVSAWVKANIGSADRDTIISWGTSSGAGNLGHRASFLLDNGANAGILRFEIGGGFSRATTAINDGEWHHVAYTLADGETSTGNIKFYIDGVLDPVSAFGNANAINSDLGMLSIGRHANSSGAARHEFSGLIDDVRIYDTVVPIADTLLTVVPEPASILLAGLGLISLVSMRRRS